MTTGPTREPIDPVRFLSNYSTGYMGTQLAAAALARRHRVTAICGPVTEPMPVQVRCVSVERAYEMERALRRLAPQADVVIMAAAVADFRPVHVQRAKIRRRGQLTITCEAVPDIIRRLPHRPGQLRVGCGVHTGDAVVKEAKRKLRDKRLDVLLAQRTDRSGAPFGRRAVEAWILQSNGTVIRLGRRAKSDLARALLDKVEELCYGQRRPTASHARS